MTHLGGHGQVGRDELCEIPLWHMTWQDCSCTGSVSEGQETSSIEEPCFSHTFHTTSRQRKEELCCLAHLPMKHSASQPYISGTGEEKWFQRGHAQILSPCQLLPGTRSARSARENHGHCPGLLLLSLFPRTAHSRGVPLSPHTAHSTWGCTGRPSSSGSCIPLGRPTTPGSILPRASPWRCPHPAQSRLPWQAELLVRGFHASVFPSTAE